jgi:O-acetyl-ADP-ribose deacetylase (regulator of RNase III)
VTRLEAIQADITTVRVDIVVNAANSSLMGGGGVDGAIHRVGGPTILEECRAIVATRGELPTGEAVITSAGHLPAQRVIHTVGPIWGSLPDDEAVALLASCYRSSLDLARDSSARTIAFPNISTGVYRFPKDLAAKTAVGAATVWLEANQDALESVTFVCFGPDNLALYETLLAN